jgi:hypothetical protein
VREIRNRLPDALAGVERGRIEYGNLTTRIAKEWEKAGLSLDAVLTPPSSPEGNQVSGLPDVVTVPRGVLKAVAILLRDHEIGHVVLKGASTVCSTPWRRRTLLSAPKWSRS